MASVITPPAITRVTPHVSEAAARREGTKAARHLASRPIGLLGVWRDALTTFSAHSAAVLLCALFGFAAPTIAGHWIAAQAVLADYAWVGSVVTLYEKPPLPMLLVQAIVALLLSSFARGVITWLAICRDGRRGAGAIRMTLAQYPALLVGSLVYGAFALACILSISPLMHGVQPGASEAKVLPVWSGLSRAGSDASRQLVERSIKLLTLGPDSPLAEPLSALFPSTSQQAAPVTLYEQSLIETQGESALAQSRRSSQSRDTWLVSMAGLVLLVLAEPLLRFRAVMAFKPSRPRQVPELPGGVGSRRFAAIAPLFDSARFGLRHFGAVTLHIWVVRIATFALCIGLVEFPLALMDNVIMPNAISLAGKSQLLPVLNFAQVSAAALVSAITLAFGAVYDARLYVALSGYDVMPESAMARSSKSATPISGPHLRM